MNRRFEIDQLNRIEVNEATIKSIADKLNRFRSSSEETRRSRRVLMESLFLQVARKRGKRFLKRGEIGRLCIGIAYCRL